MKSQVAFADENLKKEFDQLSKIKEIKFYEQLVKAFRNLEENAFCGIQIPKKLIPPFYIQKYGADNLWKYNLPDGWRLTYFITAPNKIEIVSVILEWFDRSDYERRFKY